jgi:hypothetical protein
VLGQLEKEHKARAKNAGTPFNLFAADTAVAFGIDVEASDASTSKDSIASSAVSLANSADKLTPTVVLARVNGELWELNRPLEQNCTLEFVSSDAAAGRRTLWHSSAHILGQAIERMFPGRLCFLSILTIQSEHMS